MHTYYYNTIALLIFKLVLIWQEMRGCIYYSITSINTAFTFASVSNPSRRLEYFLQLWWNNLNVIVINLWLPRKQPQTAQVFSTKTWPFRKTEYFEFTLLRESQNWQAETESILRCYYSYATRFPTHHSSLKIVFGIIFIGRHLFAWQYARVHSIIHNVWMRPTTVFGYIIIMHRHKSCKTFQNPRRTEQEYLSELK